MQERDGRRVRNRHLKRRLSSRALDARQPHRSPLYVAGHARSTLSPKNPPFRLFGFCRRPSAEPALPSGAPQRYTSFIERQPFVNNYILDMDFKQRIRFLAGWDLARKLPHVVQDYLVRGGAGQYSRAVAQV